MRRPIPEAQAAGRLTAGILFRRGGEVRAEIIRPDDHGDDAAPERELQIADSEEPCGEPDATAHRLLLDLYVGHPFPPF